MDLFELELIYLLIIFHSELVNQKVTNAISFIDSDHYFNKYD
jgi:hypothetical protein